MGSPETALFSGIGWLILLLIAVLIAIFILLQRRRRSVEPANPPIAAPAVYSRPLSPIQRLKFEEAMDVGRFCGAISDYNRQNVLFNIGADPANALIQMLSIRESARGLTLVCEMTEKGRHLFDQGEAVFTLHRDSGSLLPVLREKESHRFIEILRGKPSKWSQLANISSLVVSAAHVISAMDVAKRLGNIERKLERLEAYRKVDQYSTLERIYVKASGAIASDDRPSLLRYREELLQLRIEWRRELENVIGNAPERNGDGGKIGPKRLDGGRNRGGIHS